MPASALQPIKRVVVVGGGIGGLTVANALRRRGLDVQVLERAAKFIPTAGAGFGFSPNGQACLGSIGFSADIDAVGHPLLDHVMFSGNKILARSDHFVRAQERWGLSIMGTLRADLVDVLAKPLQADGVLRYGTTVTGVQQTTPDKARVLLACGESLEADLVVGADGINSTVADAIQPGSARLDPPIYSNESIYYGVIPLADFQPPPPVAEDDPTAFLGRPNTLVQAFDRGEFISFCCGRREGDPRPTTFVWGITYGSSAPPPRQEEWERASNREQLERMLLDKYGPDCPVLALARQTPEDRLLHFGLFYRKVKPVWHRGRVVLLGDSAHATLPYVGQGANQAIEDSVVLAQCLEDAGGFRDVEGALDSYFHKRYARTKKMVQMASYMGKLMHTEGRLASLLRDAAVRMMMRWDLILKMAEHEIIHDSPVPVPTRAHKLV